MEANSIKGQCNERETTCPDPNIVRSLYVDMAKKAPDVSITEFLFQSLDMNYETLKDQVWVEDIMTGSSYTFKEIKPLTRRIASALTRLGFQKGDVLYFSTYNVSLIYLVHIGVWLCGGVLRGGYPKEEKREFERQMREVSARFILCDQETMMPMKQAAEQLEWKVHLLSLGGNVEGATSIEGVIQNEDSSCFPQHTKINPKEDVCLIVNTSGSSGDPKAVLQTHSSLVTYFSSYGEPRTIKEPRALGKATLCMVGNYLISAYVGHASAIVHGFSFLTMSKFDQQMLLKNIIKYKPESVFLYPYAANALAQSDELEEYDLSFLKYILSGGAVLSVATVKAFAVKLPHVQVLMVFGMSELMFIAFTSIERRLMTGGEFVAGMKIGMIDDREYVTSGRLLPLCEAKIIDPVLKSSVGRNTKGNFWIRCPYLMKGYIKPNTEKGYISNVDEDGWFETGDIGYFDDEGYLYILERRSSAFKYHMHWVSPADIEGIIVGHPAVSTVGVVGVPNLTTTASARAYIVLKPSYDVTEEEIKSYVADRAPYFMHLHGGVGFLDKIPQNRGGKIDRVALLNRAITESNQETSATTEIGNKKS